MISIDLNFPGVEVTPEGTTEIVATVGHMTPERQAIALQHRVPMEMNIRKTMGGDLIIRDHKNIYIVVKPSEKLIVTFPRELDNELSRRSQSDFFKTMVARGLIAAEDIEGGNGYGTVQARYPESAVATQDTLQMVLFGIFNWLSDVRPQQELVKQYNAKMTDRRTNPDPAQSTDPEEISRMETELGLDNTIRSFTYNLYAGYPYYGLYYL
jgi:hypothetical protein